jgi:tetratricopeptide (TPR) repeat protein
MRELARQSRLNETTRDFGVITLGVRKHKKREQVWALLGQGTSMYAQGRYERARVWFVRAATRAARTNQPREAAEAEHDLMTIASEIGTYRQGARHLRRALEHYPVKHWRLPYLVHDFAYLLIQNGQYAPALPLLSKLTGVIPRSEQLLLWSAIARAAAGTGETQKYEAALANVADLIGLRPEHSAPALLNLADAALLRSDWERAAKLARETLSLAASRGEADVVKSANALLARIGSQDKPKQDSRVDDVSISVLSRDLLAKLAHWQTPGRGRPGSPPRER